MPVRCGRSRRAARWVRGPCGVGSAKDQRCPQSLLSPGRCPGPAAPQTAVAFVPKSARRR